MGVFVRKCGEHFITNTLAETKLLQLACISNIQAEYDIVAKQAETLTKEEAMENKLIRESVNIGGILYNSPQEQSVELDCILPDYCPEIFKVLSLKVSPCITKQSVEGSRLSYEMAVSISLMYSSESGEIFTLKQSLDYTKWVDLPYPPKNPGILISPVTDSQSCRVINKRRVDIRAIISVGIRVTQEENISVISGGTGDGLQFKKDQFTYPVKRLFKSRKVTILEELGFPDGVTGIVSVLKSDAYVTSCDKKVLSGKLITKGEVSVSVIYIAEGEAVPKSMTGTLPFSQILDIEGLDERYEICADGCVVCCDVSYDDGKLMAGIDIEVKCFAIRFDMKELATDVFSTKYDAEGVYSNIQLDGVPLCVNESHKQKLTLAYSEGELSEVYFAGTGVKSVSFAELDNGEGVIYGKICAYVFGRNESGKNVYFESTGNFEHKLPTKGEAIWICANTSAVQYTLTSSNEIEITADIKLRGCINQSETAKLMSDIRVNYNSENKENCEFALKLYFCREGESAWEIAKRCRTSPEGIIRENELDGGVITSAGMLLIPYTN